MPDHRSSPPSPPSSAPEAPLGYVAHRLSCPLADQTPSGRIILLPAQVKTEIDAARSLDFQRRAAEQIREEEQRLHQARAAKLREAEAEAVPEEVEEPYLANTDDKSEAGTDFDPGQGGRPAFFYPVYTKAELAAFKSRIGRSTDKEVRRRDEYVARLLQAKGCERRIGMPVKNITSVMFGGPDLKDIYVTSMARVKHLSVHDHFAAEAKPQFSAGALFRVSGLGIQGLAESRFAC